MVKTKAAKSLADTQDGPWTVALNLPQIDQEQTEWCWAACAQMVLRYKGNQTVQQCDLANKQFGQTNCCGFPGSALCNAPALVKDISSVYSDWGLRATYQPSNVKFEVLQSELKAGRPVLVGLAFNGGGAHEALVCGWKVDATGPCLLINDPLYGSGAVYYANLCLAYGKGTWQWTWTNIH